MVQAEGGAYAKALRHAYLRTTRETRVAGGTDEATSMGVLVTTAATRNQILDLF